MFVPFGTLRVWLLVNFWLFLDVVKVFQLSKKTFNVCVNLTQTFCLTLIEYWERGKKGREKEIESESEADCADRHETGTSAVREREREREEKKVQKLEL